MRVLKLHLAWNLMTAPTEVRSPLPTQYNTPAPFLYGDTIIYFRIRISLLTLCCVFSIGAKAQSVSITVGELGAALDSQEQEADAVRRLILQRIQSRFDASEIGFDNGQLIYEQSSTNLTVEDGCNRTIVLRMQTRISLQSDSRFVLNIDSLHDPVTLSLALNAQLSATGRARQIFGFRFGSCQDVARDSFDFSALGPVSVLLDLALELNPEFVTPTTLRLTPSLTVSSQLTGWDLRVDVDDSIIRRLLEELLQAEVEDAFGPDQIESELGQLQAAANELLADALPNGFLDIELPEPDDEQIIALYRLLQADARFPLTLGFVQEHRHELLAALILGDDDLLSDITADAVACQAADILQIPLAHEPVYTMAASGCSAIDDALDSEPLFSDAACEQPLAAITTTLVDFCTTALSPDRLGNAASNTHELERWTLSPGNRFDIGSLSITGMLQPYSQRVNYKTVITDRGECRLEMRIYRRHPDTTGTIPVLALHGGSWQHRGSGFLGIETTATQFVHNGFTVFAPFYRLIGTDDGNAECNDASIFDALEDTNDAFSWMLANADRYGASGKPVVFGQSAGGHLAASLLVNRADDVSKGILFYAPTDFRDFAQRIQQGLYTGSRGRRILEAVTDQRIEEVDLDSPLILNNSFPAIIAAQPDAYPPLFLLHGQRDDLLPFRQSVRLCNAMSGNPEEGPASLDPDSTPLRTTVSCDNRGSELHLLREGEHALDLCIAPELCFAGSPESRRVTEKSLLRMFRWAAADRLPLTPQNDVVQNNTVSGAASVLLLLGLSLLWFCRHSRFTCRRSPD